MNWKNWKKILKRQAVREAPLKRILLETDCPVTYQGHVSRPSDVRITLNEVVKIKGLSIKKVAERTSQNVIELLGPFEGMPNH